MSNVLDLPNEVLQKIVAMSGNTENFKNLDNERFDDQYQKEQKFYTIKDKVDPIFVKKLIINTKDIKKIEKYKYIESLYVYCPDISKLKVNFNFLTNFDLLKNFYFYFDTTSGEDDENVYEFDSLLSNLSKMEKIHIFSGYECTYHHFFMSVQLSENIREFRTNVHSIFDGDVEYLDVLEIPFETLIESDYPYAKRLVLNNYKEEIQDDEFEDFCKNTYQEFDEIEISDCSSIRFKALDKLIFNTLIMRYEEYFDRFKRTIEKGIYYIKPTKPYSYEDTKIQVKNLFKARQYEFRDYKDYISTQDTLYRLLNDHFIM